jgi:molybdopterin-guanine dinucleotide biosynthesis protein A
MKADRPAGVILAGGRSSRMGVTRKALLELNGKCLLTRVINRLQKHLDPLLLSCESATDEFATFDLPVVPDLLPNHRGPLTGLCSALQFLADTGHDNGLVLCPCDAPFIPENLVQVLVDASRAEEKPVAVVSYKGVVQPTFSIWHAHHLPVIHDAVVKKGIGGLKHILTSIPHEVVEWAVSEPPPFFNVNTPEDIKSAAAWLDRMQT